MNRIDKPKQAFIGRYYHALEQKGRLSIPASFRAQLKPTATITTGLDGCLFVYPLVEWEKTLESLSKFPFTKKNARDWIRLQANNASAVTFDTLGRIQIPEYLREKLKLGKEIVIVGSYNRIEIWDRDRYHTYFEDIEKRAESIAEELPDISQNS